MEIFGFLFGLGCLVVIAWAMPSAVRVATIALLDRAVFGRKHRRRKQTPGRSPSPPEVRGRETSAPSSPTPPISPPPRAIALVQPPVSSRVRLSISRHQQYIRLVDSGLEQLLRR